MIHFFRSLFRWEHNGITAVCDIGYSGIRILLLDTLHDCRVISHADCTLPSFSHDTQKRFLILREKYIFRTLENAEKKLGKSVESILFAVHGSKEFFQDVPIIQWEKMTKKIRANFLGCYAFPTIYHVGLQEQKNYFLVDIWTHTSSISLVKNGFLHAWEHFPIGGNIFTQKVQQCLSLEKLQEAEQVKIAFSLDTEKFPALHSEDFHTSINDWMTAFFVTLHNFSGTDFPKNIFFCGNGSLFRGIRNILKNDMLPYKKLWFIDTPNIHLMYNAGISFNHGVQQEEIIPWIPVRMLAKFYSIMLKKKLLFKYKYTSFFYILFFCNNFLLR